MKMRMPKSHVQTTTLKPEAFSHHYKKGHVTFPPKGQRAQGTLFDLLSKFLL